MKPGTSPWLRLLLVPALVVISTTALPNNTNRTTAASLGSCLASLQAVETCLGASSSSSPTTNATTLLCLEEALRTHGGFDGCLDATWGLVRNCAQEGIGLRACLKQHGASAQAIARTIGNSGSSSASRWRRDPPSDDSSSGCRAALETATQTVAGAEAVLASGRVALVFGVMGKLFSQFNETGVPPMYLFSGHVQSYGDADACKAIGGFQYCWLQLDILPTIVRAGVCVPQECSLQDLVNVTNSLLQAVGEVSGSSSSNSTVPEIDFSHVEGQCGDYVFPATAGTYVMLVLTGLLVLLVLGGTWVDYQEAREEEEEEEEEDKGEEGEVHEGYTRLDHEGGKGVGKRGGRSSEEKDALLDRDVKKAQLLENGNGNGKSSSSSSSAVQKKKQQQQQSHSLSRKVLDCFSLYKTWPSLVGPARPGPFNALDGVRVFSMSWVVLGHLFVFPTEITSYTNQDAILPPDGLLGTYAGQAIISAEFSVDTFFCIGAFVAAYALTKHLQKAMAPSPPSSSMPVPSAPAADYTKTENGLSSSEQQQQQQQQRQKKLGWAWVPMLYLHRYLRLSPLYFYILAMYLYVQKVVNSGPFWGLLKQDYDECHRWWWSNALYINTLVPWNGVMGCYPVSWYMSVDFLLFLLLPFLTLAYVKNKRVGYVLPMALWTASTIYAYWLALAKGDSQFVFGTQITQITDYQVDYYFKAWARAPVYLIGVMCAFLWLDHTAAVAEVKSSRGQSNWFTKVLAGNRKPRLTLPILGLFLVSFVLLALTCYGGQPAYHAPLAPVWDSSYLALSRSAWCLGLMLLCFLLFEGYGGLIKGLLENPVCAVLGRLTFGAYLLHPAIIFLVYGDAIVPTHWSPIWISFSFLGTLTTVFLFAAVGFLLVEKPFANLERVLFAGLGAGKKEK